jgi:GNAT superfamily N-acetyltransferase
MTEQITAQADEALINSLKERSWQEDQSLESSEPIIIIGAINGEKRGKLSASLLVEKRLDKKTGNYSECSRMIDLGDIEVDQEHRRQGLGTTMLSELERQAIMLKATKISGKITDGDEKETPGLLGFYRGNGYVVKKAGNEWKWYIEKQLLENRPC